jgi:hypothetical protein
MATLTVNLVRRRRAARVLGFCAALSAIALTGAFAQPGGSANQAAPKEESATSTGTPRLELTPTALNFGEVWQGERAAGEFTVRNIGTAPLTLAVKSSCGCTVASKPRSPLIPGDSDTFEIKYDTLKRRGKAQQQVTVTTNDPDQPTVHIAVTGEVKPLYEASPQEGLIFDRLTCDSQVSKSIRIKSKYEGPLHLKLRPDQDFGPFDMELKEIQPGVEYELTATTKPPLSQEFAHVSAVIETDAVRSPEIHIPVHAMVQQDISFRPKLIRAQRLLIIPREETITVTYRADRPFKVTEVRPSAANIKVEMLPPRPAREGEGWLEQPIRVTLPPGDQLPQGEMFISVLTNSSEPRFQELRIPIQVVESHGTSSADPPSSPGSGQNQRVALWRSPGVQNGEIFQ